MPSRSYYPPGKDAHDTMRSAHGRRTSSHVHRSRIRAAARKPRAQAPARSWYIAPKAATASTGELSCHPGRPGVGVCSFSRNSGSGGTEESVVAVTPVVPSVFPAVAIVASRGSGNDAHLRLLTAASILTPVPSCAALAATLAPSDSTLPPPTRTSSPTTHFSLDARLRIKSK